MCLLIVLIIATIIPGVIDTIDYALDPHHDKYDSPIHSYINPILIILFWPLGVGIAVAITIITIASLRKGKRMAYVIKRIAYVLWVIYLIILYLLFPFMLDVLVVKWT